jgi:hypothetical protein
MMRRVMVSVLGWRQLAYKLYTRLSDRVSGPGATSHDRAVPERAGEARAYRQTGNERGLGRVVDVRLALPGPPARLKRLVQLGVPAPPLPVDQMELGEVPQRSV